MQNNHLQSSVDYMQIPACDTHNPRSNFPCTKSNHPMSTFTKQVHGRHLSIPSDREHLNTALRIQPH